MAMPICPTISGDFADHHGQKCWARRVTQTRYVAIRMLIYLNECAQEHCGLLLFLHLFLIGEVAASQCSLLLHTFKVEMLNELCLNGLVHIPRPLQQRCCQKYPRRADLRLKLWPVKTRTSPPYTTRALIKCPRPRNAAEKQRA